MKFLRSLANIADANSTRQQAIHSSPEIVRRYPIRQRDGGDLRNRMHARISAPRAGHMHRRAFDDADYVLEHSLNGSKARLYLPAMKIRAIVCDVEAQPAGHAAAR